MAVGASGQVVAFEPDPRTRAVLRSNLERHGVADRCEVRGEAVGETRTTLSLALYENDVVLQCGPARSAVFHAIAEVAKIDVDCVPLDEVIKGQVGMVKIDVEGYELGVLRGAEGLLGRSPDAILVIEVNPAAQELPAVPLRT